MLSLSGLLYVMCCAKFILTEKIRSCLKFLGGKLFFFRIFNDHVFEGNSKTSFNSHNDPRRQTQQSHVSDKIIGFMEVRGLGHNHTVVVSFRGQILNHHVMLNVRRFLWE